MIVNNETDDKGITEIITGRMESIRVVRTDSDDQAFRDLVKMLDADLLGRYGDEQAFFDQFNKLDKIKNVVVAWMDAMPVGCGAFKQFDDRSAEIKRMFVRSDHRGKKIGSLLIKELENWAAELGFESTVLETGTSQPEAIRLYQNAGYAFIDNYGPYIGNQSSVCMTKNLTGTEGQ